MLEHHAARMQDEMRSQCAGIKSTWRQESLAHAPLDAVSLVGLTDHLANRESDRAGR